MFKKWLSHCGSLFLCLLQNSLIVKTDYMLKWIKNIFKKKVVLEDNTVLPKLNLDKYNMRLNIKTMCMYEQIAHKSFMKIEDENDVVKVLYASFIVNNEEYKYMTFNTFTYLIKDERVMKWMLSEYEKLSKYISQFQRQDVIEGKEEKEIPMITEIASTLIVKIGMDAHYVYYSMDLWEINQYLETMFDKYKEAMTEKRMFTYLQMLPMMDCKKVKGPEKILPFPWEKEEENNKALEENTQATLNFLGQTQNTESDG